MCGSWRSANHTSSALRYLNRSSTSPPHGLLNSFQLSLASRHYGADGKPKTAAEGWNPSILSLYGTVCTVPVPSWAA